jgi:transcriptional regulator with PAS, ATPase and Fis domain
MLIGESAAMSELRARLARVARTSFTVLIEGESGSGKELVGRELHRQSPRSRGPFIAVNCAAIVESLLEAELFGIEDRTATGVRGRRGKFELADRGTLFLDEVADLSPASQAKLLRVLQDMTVERVGGSSSQVVDTRIVAATNRSLPEMVSGGRFRADLYYRLAGVEIVVPPLRARREDIPLLVDHFLELYGQRGVVRIGPDAVEALRAYDWPGNVRQLARVLERALALATTSEVGAADLPEAIVQNGIYRRHAGMGEDSLRAWSSRYVRSVLERCRGNKRQACEVLDITYHTLKSHLDYAGRQPRRRPLPGHVVDAEEKPMPVRCELEAS